MIRQICVKSRTRVELIDITAEVQAAVHNSRVRSGICHVTVLHTTAGLTINEGADPAVQRDLENYLNRLIPKDIHFTHAEGNSDAHIKSSLVGVSKTLFIEDGRLLLGTWQAIFFCEFDGPRSRKVAIKVLPDP